jgi:hypothetical protein
MTPMAKKFFAASLIYLGIGLLAQAVSGFDAWLGFNPLAYTAIATTEQILLLGWLTQLGLALAYDRWLAPTQLELKDTTSTSNPQYPKSTMSAIQVPVRSSPKSVMIVFVLFNIGLPLVILGQPGLALIGGAWLGVVAAVGGILMLLAGLMFIRQAWLTMRKN